MATHSKNLHANTRATLLVASDSADLAEARASVVGAVVPVYDEDREPVSKLYMEKNPQASAWVSFRDFAFYRMEIVEVYFIAGFGAMGWVSADDYGNA